MNAQPNPGARWSLRTRLTRRIIVGVIAISEARFVVSAPGTYELTPPKLSGYKDPGPQRIEVFAGQETQFVVEYERER